MEAWMLFPLIAAAIGWFTNFLAVRMIFRPHRRISVLGLPIQGLLPKRHTQFAAKIGATVADHLLSTEDIRRAVENPAVQDKLRAGVEAKIEDFFANKLTAKVPMLAAFSGSSTFDSIKQMMVDEVQGMMTSAAEMVGESIDSTLDLGQVVEQRILAFDMRHLEAIVLQIARTELRWIEILGAVLGFLVGLVQVALLHWLG